MNDVVEYRETVDKVFYDICENIERSSSNISAEQRIEINREYGFVYYYRKGEVVS